MPKKKPTNINNPKAVKNAAKMISADDVEEDIPPRVMTIKRSSLSLSLKAFLEEVKNLFYPNVTKSLQTSKNMGFKTILSFADDYKISNILSINCSPTNAFLKFSKVKSGPTFTQSISNQLNSKLIRAQNDRSIKQKIDNVLKQNPLLILSGFEASEITFSSGNQSNGNISKTIVTKQLSILNTSFSTMFPTINFKRLDVNKLNRVISIRALVDPDSTSPLKFRIRLQLRQYYLSLEKQIDVLFKQSLEQRYGQSMGTREKRKMKLLLNNESVETEQSMDMVEIGPRFDLVLHKIEDGFLNRPSSILFHHTLTEQEAMRIKHAHFKSNQQQKKNKIKVVTSEEQQAKDSVKTVAGEKKGDEEEEKDGGEEQEDRNVDNNEIRKLQMQRVKIQKKYKLKSRSSNSQSNLKRKRAIVD